jgi:hypothetical protein
MQLTREQERVLDGERGEAAQRLMRLLVALGEIYGAGRLIPVASAQISGVSYKSIGDPGLELLEELAGKGARVSVPTTLNPAGMDFQRWRELGIPEKFARKQLRIIEAFRRMGVEVTATCVPYLVGSRPGPGEHLAWAESSAVIFANSVLGARTNRESGLSALAAAVCGVTPDYGFHQDENRRATVIVEVTVRLQGAADFGALGHYVGSRLPNSVPFFRGLGRATEDELKALGAAMAASGAIALFHVEGVTPEAGAQELKSLERHSFGPEELRRAREDLGSDCEPELGVVGCPHASLAEIEEVAEKLRGRRLRRPLWVCTARTIKEEAERLGLVEAIESAGGRVIADTCAVVAPLELLGFRCVVVNSAKAARYLPSLCKQRVVYRGLDEMLEMLAGEVPTQNTKTEPRSPNG